MKRKFFSKKLIILASITCLSVASFFSPTVTITAQAEESATIAPYSDDIKWRFKEENGKLYRRLFNYTTNEWLGQWEYVGDL